jgi:2-polyprenyl-6-methoxyphenol hydroxylase-like FAD-dependent oxidoreductase
MSEEVAIIGAGLSGLTLALALHQQGIKATVFESRSAPLNIGGAVMLSPNALKVLDALGLYQNVRSKGYNFDLLEMQKVTGEVVETYEFGGIDKYQYQANRIYRHELIDVILSEIKTKDISVMYGQRFYRVVEETDDFVTWESADGTQHTAKLLVGADGIHSSVRKYLYPNLVPKFTGMGGISAAVPANQVIHSGGKIDKPLTIIAEGKGAFVVAPQKADASEIFFGKQKHMTERDREGWDAMFADKEKLVKLLQEGSEAFGQIAITATKNISHNKINVWPFYVIPPLDNWTSDKRRVVIVGDGAHAIPPSAGQGINQAFEDVYMFALLLAESSKGKVEFAEALKFWQTYRQGRVDKVLQLNKQIDMRRMPKDTNSKQDGSDEEVPFDLAWLYEPDFKAVVESWVQSVC